MMVAVYSELATANTAFHFAQEEVARIHECQ